MKRFSICVILGVLFLLASCQEKEKSVKTVYINPSTISVAEGANMTLSVTVEPQDALWSTVDWASKDNSIATVTKKGTVTGIKTGKTIVTATVNGVQGACEVTVYKDVVPVTGVTLSDKTLNIGVGDTKTLGADVSPSGATDKSLAWTSSDTGVATVEAGAVKGVAKGECDITVKTVDGGFEDKCHVTVTETPVQSIAFKGGSTYALMVDEGSSKAVEIEFNPSFASNKNVTLASGDETLATVSGGSGGKGTVTFKSGKYGPVIITATSEIDSRTASQVFFVKGSEPVYTAPSGTLYAGRKETYSFNTAAYPGASEISWSNGDKTLKGAEVGLAVGPGSSEVVLSAVYGSVTAQFSIPVTAEEFWMNISLPSPSNPRNTYPVFNKECTKAYFVTRGEPRSLFELDLEGRKLGWRFAMSGNNTNGGDICLVPTTGDIICSDVSTVYCITPGGSVKWQMEVNGGTSPSSLSGNGPSLSNDCSVVFAPCTDNWFYALDASTGAVLDKYQFANAACQVAVYGDDEIVILQRLTDRGIIFLQFKAGKFIENAVIDAPVKTASDIITPCVTKDQAKVFFQAEGYTFSVDLKKRMLADVPTAARNGYHWSGCITTDGILCQPEQSPTRIEVIGVNENIADASRWRLAFELNGVNNLLNHGGIACDDDGNIYFFINESGGASFYKLRLEDKFFYKAEKLSTVPNIPEAQGFFAYGGGYLIGGGGNATENHVYVRCVDADRGRGWSGAGGDAQATKNGNLVYAD